MSCPFRHKFNLRFVCCRGTREFLFSSQVFSSHEALQDLAVETANEHDIRYVLAQDPDSDRFAAAEKRYAKSGKAKVYPLMH